MWITFKRIIRSGFIHFWRNGVVSVASVLVMSVTLFVIGSLIFLGAVLDSSLSQIKDKVDINIYFNSKAIEDDILSIKKSLMNLPEVETVEYVSRDDALENFKKRHSNDYLTLQALSELDDNPLGASLNVRAKDTSQYESIARFFESKNALSRDGNVIIDKINYYQNKIVIDRLTKIIKGSQQLGFAVAVVLLLLSILITFNTIRLTIYISKEEIGIMRLVGASKLRIRGAFMIEGAIYGIVATILTLLIFWPITAWLGRHMTLFFGLNLYDYYINNLLQISVMILLGGVILGTVSSLLATRKYLNK